MTWNDLAKVVKKSAPILGAAIGGPAGGAVGGAVSLLLGAFGLGEDATADQVAQAIQMDPQAAVKLRELEMAHRETLEKIVLEHERIRLADVASARARQVDSEKATGKRDTNLYVLAWVSVIGFYVILAIALVVDMPTSEMAKTALAMLFGALVGNTKDVYGYFFGSSKSSVDKTSLLASRPGAGGPGS